MLCAFGIDGGMAKSIDAETAEKVIKLLGGTRAAARLLDCPPTTVQNWISNGVPKWRVPQIKAAAERKGVRLPAAARAA